jgi:hypothetical protein
MSSHRNIERLVGSNLIPPLSLISIDFESDPEEAKLSEVPPSGKPREILPSHHQRQLNRSLWHRFSFIKVYKSRATN